MIQDLLHGQGVGLRGNGSITYQRKDVAWPSWNGLSENFRFFIAYLFAKIEEDLPLQGPNRAICLGMIEFLPKNLQHSVSHWFLKGREARDFDWKKLSNYFIDHFENKYLVITAGNELTSIRYGKHQFFRGFLKDFNYKLMQCGGGDLPRIGKLIHI